MYITQTDRIRKEKDFLQNPYFPRDFIIITKMCRVESVPLPLAGSHRAIV